MPSCGSSRTRYAVSIAVLSLLVISVCIFLPIYYLTLDESGDDSAQDLNVQLKVPRPRKDWKQKCDNKISKLVDCFPDDKVTETTCIGRGCCWLSGPNMQNNIHNGTLPTPLCVYPSNFGYVISGHEEHFHDWYDLPLTRHHLPSRYGDDINAIRVRIEMQTPNRLHIKVYNFADDEEDADFSEPEIPVEKKKNAQGQGETKDLYAVSYVKTAIPFGLHVRRILTGTMILNTSISGLTFAKHFRQIAFILPSGKFVTSPFPAGSNRATFFSRDPKKPTDPTTAASSYPIYTFLESDGNCHGVLFLNSYPAEMEMRNVDSNSVITVRALGGSLDFYLFMGPSHEDVARQIAEAVGRPFFPPYWFLGTHMMVDESENIEEIREMLSLADNGGQIYDVVGFGRQYRNGKLDFTVDSQRYKNLRLFVEELHQARRHVSISVDPTVSSDQPEGSYPPYDDGRRFSVFINDSLTNRPLIGWSDSGQSVFADFGHSTSKGWWRRRLTRWNEELQFDSLILEDETPLNLVDGSLHGCVEDDYNFPSYIPFALRGSPLFKETVCMDSWQRWDGKAVRHFAVHNIFGHSMAKATYDAVKTIGDKRIPLVSHSTFIGSGHYTGLYLKHYYATWEQMTLSISHIIDHNMYAMPMVGSAACGMKREFDSFNSDADLCTRWIQLAAFYPLFQIDRDTLICAGNNGRGALSAVKTRYNLLPYLYTLFYLSSTEGSTVVRSLIHEFADDQNTHTIREQFMWGPAIMINPVLQKGVNEVQVYVPKGRWYDYYTGSKLDSKGEWSYFSAAKDKMSIFLRGGYVIPTHNYSTTSTVSRNNSLHLVVALSMDMRAKGNLFWDDGESRDSVEKRDYIVVNFTAANDRLKISGQKGRTNLSPGFSNTIFASVDILGIPKAPTHVAITDVGILTKQQAKWNDKTKILNIVGIIIPLKDTLQLEWHFS